MFVQTNSVKSIKKYISERLGELFSENEIKLITNTAICSRLQIAPNDLVGINEQLLSESDLLFFRSIVKRLLANEPFQYVIGNTFFYGLELKCDSRALIPRPETEELVDWIKETFENQTPDLIADICTGSGCIALGLKSIFPKTVVVATDISKAALELTQENSSLTDLEISIEEFDATNSTAYFPDYEFSSFDCWVSNPPYIPEIEKNEMSQNVVEFEPHLALFVPTNNPLIFYSKIAEMALNYLKFEGYLFFEVHENLGEDVFQLLKDKGFISIELKKDLQGKNRMIKAQKK